VSEREHDHGHDSFIRYDEVFKDGVNGLLYCQLVELNSGQNDPGNRVLTEISRDSFM
jgi:hypothetical protein